jgi:hypothetical protein
MPNIMPTGFLALIQKEDPLALVILARLLVLLKFVDESWWLKGTAEYEIRGLHRVVLVEWKWAVEWPMRLLESVRPEDKLN